MFQTTLESQVTQTKTCKKHTRQKNTYLRKAAAFDRDGGSGFVPLNVPPRSSKFRFERFSKPVFRSFPNFASDLFFYLSFLWIIFLVFASSKFTQKKTKHTLILLRSAWIKLERELQLPDLSGWCCAVCIACVVYLH